MESRAEMGQGNEGNDGKCRGVTRRSFLADTGMGFTGLALGAMLFREGIAQAAPPAPKTGGAGRIEEERRPHFLPKAKSVIWIFLCGGVSHVESFDVKPELNRYAGLTIANTPHRRVLEDFIGAVTNGRAPACDGREGRNSVAVIEAIYRSAASGGSETP